VLGGLGDDMIIDMLRQASSEGREISPTLTGLLGKLARCSRPGRDPPRRAVSAAGDGPRAERAGSPGASAPVAGAASGTGTRIDARTGKDGVRAPSSCQSTWQSCSTGKNMKGYVEKEYDTS